MRLLLQAAISQVLSWSTATPDNVACSTVTNTCHQLNYPN
jgi:hypothetical protein